jgi:hypothetical protein
MKDSEILIKAKDLIENDTETFLCWAIIRVGNTLEDSSQSASLLDWVEDMLGDSKWYSGWLYKHHGEIAEKMTLQDRKQGRLQWLDWMIDYCKKEEAKSK